MLAYAQHPGLEDPMAKRRKYDLVPALEEHLLQVPAANRKSGMLGPTMMLSGHEGEVFGAEFSTDGRHVASCAHDKTILLWNVYGECENYGMLKGHTNAVLEVHWSPDGSQIYSCSADKSVQVFDVDTGKRVKKLNGHTAIVNSVQVARRGSPMAVSGGDDGTTKVWDLRTRRCVHTFEHQYQILSVCFDDTGERIFAGSLDNTVICYDMKTREESFVLEDHKDSVTSVDLSADGQSLLTNSMDQSLKVWDVRPYVPGHRLRQHLTGASHNFEKNLIRARWSSDDRWAVAGSSDRCVYVWDMKSGQLTYKLPGHAGSVNDVGFHPREPIVLSASSDKRVFMGELGD